MSQFAFDEPLALPAPAGLRTMIERVPSDSQLSKRLAEWGALRRDGWDVTALLAPDRKTVVLLASVSV